MPAKMKTPQPHLHFARLDDDDDEDMQLDKHDVGGRFGGALSGLDIDTDSADAWLWPIGLILLWVLVLLIENVFFDTDAQGLRKLPVVMGAAGQVSLMKPLTSWVASIAIAHRFLGAILFVIDRLLVFIVMIIASIVSGFMHATFGHLLGNAIVLLLVMGAGFAIHFPLGRLVRNWLILSGLGIGLTWLVLDFMSFFVQHAHIHGCLWEVIHSTEPIVGASVGIYGLVAFMIIAIIKNIHMSKFSVLWLIGMIILAIALLLSRWQSLKGLTPGDNIDTALWMTVWMHFVGFLIGIIQGIHDRTQLY